MNVYSLWFIWMLVFYTTGYRCSHGYFYRRRLVLWSNGGLQQAPGSSVYSTGREESQLFFEHVLRTGRPEFTLECKSDAGAFIKWCGPAHEFLSLHIISLKKVFNKMGVLRFVYMNTPVSQQQNIIIV